MQGFPTVLIVGAGPTGLMMACELARYGISIRIIDKKPERTQTSNAAVIHIRSLELLDHIGIVDRFLSLGVQCKAFRLHGIDGQELARIPLDQNDSHYLFSLFIPQSETERILNEHLEEFHRTVERPVELIDIKQEDQKVISTLRHANGEIETVISDWLIGCDGYHSIVREKCYISFSGEDLREEYIVGDFELKSELSQDSGDGFLGTGKVLAFFPLGSNKYRVVANLDRSGGIEANLSQKEIMKLIEERSHGLFKVSSVLRISPFWIHSKIAKRMRKGLAFIAGDAAHVHSPAGGQGMNTGLQDAYNLAWKLALVIKNQANPSLLDSYQAERYPISQTIVSATEHLTKIGVSAIPFLPKLRDFLIKNTVGRSKFLQKKLGGLLTQSLICYTNSPIIDYQTKMKKGAPQSGEQAPDIFIAPSQRLYDYFRNLHHHLLLFTSYQMSNENTHFFKKIIEGITSQYTDIIPWIVAPKTIPKLVNVIVDSDFVVHKRYGFDQPGLCLIRPDQYIAFISIGWDLAGLEKLLNTYLKTV